MNKTSLIVSLIVGTFGIIAHGQDIIVTPCTNDATSLFVEISGSSAQQIYQSIAKRLKVPVDELGETQANDMLCGPLSLSPGQPVAVRCSYLMKGNKNIPYPQFDPGFSGEKKVVCNLPADKKSNSTDQRLESCMKNLKSINDVMGRLSAGVPVSENDYKQIRSIESTISTLLKNESTAAPAK